MKLETPNLVASCATLPLWVIAYTISYTATVGEENTNLLAVAGMMIFILWGVNILGSLLGIVSIAFNCFQLDFPSGMVWGWHSLPSIFRHVLHHFPRNVQITP